MKDSYTDLDLERRILTTVHLIGPQPDLPGKVYLVTEVQTSEGGRGQGRARRVMQEVLTDADREGVTLILAPDSQADSSMNYDQLVAWYCRLGFKFDTNEPIMRRYPSSEDEERQ